MDKGKIRLIDKDSEKWGILFDLFRRSSNEEEVLVKKIITSLGSRKYDSLLDIGAGDGSITQKIMPFFDKITAIDRLDSNIYFLKFLGVEAEKHLWEVYHSNKLFDIIFASHVMYYFPSKDWTKEIIRMIKLLKPGGRIFAIFNSQKGEYTDFLKYFYPIVHKEPIEEIHSGDIVNELKKQGIDSKYNQVKSEVIFENRIHFLSLCTFLLDYEIAENEPIKDKLNMYFSNLSRTNNGRRKMTILEDFIEIGGIS